MFVETEELKAFNGCNELKLLKLLKKRCINALKSFIVCATFGSLRGVDDLKVLDVF